MMPIKIKLLCATIMLLTAFSFNPVKGMDLTMLDVVEQSGGPNYAAGRKRITDLDPSIQMPTFEELVTHEKSSDPAVISKRSLTLCMAALSDDPLVRGEANLRLAMQHLKYALLMSEGPSADIAAPGNLKYIERAKMLLDRAVEGGCNGDASLYRAILGLRGELYPRVCKEKELGELFRTLYGLEVHNFDFGGHPPSDMNRACRVPLKTGGFVRFSFLAYYIIDTANVSDFYKRVNFEEFASGYWPRYGRAVKLGDRAGALFYNAETPGELTPKQKEYFPEISKDCVKGTYKVTVNEEALKADAPKYPYALEEWTRYLYHRMKGFDKNRIPILEELAETETDNFFDLFAGFELALFNLE